MRRAPVGVVLVSSLALALIAAPVSAGPPLFTFSVNIGSSCISGSGPLNDDITITHKNSDGLLRSTTPVHSSGTGSWSACLAFNVNPGDKLRAADASDQRQVTVPNLTGHADRATDVVAGTAPANSSVTLAYYHCDPAGCAYVGPLTRPTNGSGAWSGDLTSLGDARGGDMLYVYWGAFDTFYLPVYFPYVQVTIGSPTFDGYAERGSTTKVTLKSGGGATRGSGKAVAAYGNASFSGTLVKDGKPVNVHVGDKVVTPFGPASGFSVIAITAVPNAANDHVTGSCPANHGVLVNAYDPTSPYHAPGYSYAYTTTDGTGHYSADMSNVTYPFDLQSGDLIKVTCRLPSGDREIITTHVP